LIGNYLKIPSIYYPFDISSENFIKELENSNWKDDTSQKELKICPTH